jgi:cell division protein FtsQ
MIDQKGQKRRRLKGNRLIKGKAPRDWKRIFHRGLRIVLVCGSVVLGAGGTVLAARVLFESDYFGVEKVSIMNLQRLSSEEIMSASDIRGGDNIFSLDLELIGRKIEENPWVSRADVERIFPREVVVKVTEREERAIIDLGYLYYVDKNGEIFKGLTAGDRLDYPVITGLNRQFFLEQPEQARELLLQAVALLADLAGRDQFNIDEVSEVNVDVKDGFELTTCRGGIPVHLGFSPFAAKLARLEKIYGEIRPRFGMIRAIDLNVVDRVIVRMDRHIALNQG